MSKSYIKFMTEEAMETLRANIPAATELLIQNPTDPSWLDDFVPGKVFVTKNYQIDDFELKVPTGEEDSSVRFENAVAMYQGLRELPRYVLCEEGFWMWMNFKYCAVATANMPVSKKGTTLRDHWLFGFGARRTLVFSPLARDFICVALTIDDTAEDPFELTRYAFGVYERYRVLAFRAYSNDPKVVHGVLRGMKIAEDERGGKCKSGNYLPLAEYVSQQAGLQLLASISEGEIKSLVHDECLRMMTAQDEEREPKPGEGQKSDQKTEQHEERRSLFSRLRGSRSRK